MRLSLSYAHHVLDCHVAIDRASERQVSWLGGAHPVLWRENSEMQLPLWSPDPPIRPACLCIGLSPVPEGLTPLAVYGYLCPAKSLSPGAGQRWQEQWSSLLLVLPFSLSHRLLIFSSANGFPE